LAKWFQTNLIKEIPLTPFNKGGNYSPPFNKAARHEPFGPELTAEGLAEYGGGRDLKHDRIYT